MRHSFPSSPANLACLALFVSCLLSVEQAVQANETSDIHRSEREVLDELLEILHSLPSNSEADDTKLVLPPTEKAETARIPARSPAQQNADDSPRVSVQISLPSRRHSRLDELLKSSAGKPAGRPAGTSGSPSQSRASSPSNSQAGSQGSGSRQASGGARASTPSGSQAGSQGSGGRRASGGALPSSPANNSTTARQSAGRTGNQGVLPAGSGATAASSSSQQQAGKQGSANRQANGKSGGALPSSPANNSATAGQQSAGRAGNQGTLPAGSGATASKQASTGPSGDGSDLFPTFEGGSEQGKGTRGQSRTGQGVAQNADEELASVLKNLDLALLEYSRRSGNSQNEMLIEEVIGSPENAGGSGTEGEDGSQSGERASNQPSGSDSNQQGSGTEIGTAGVQKPEGRGYGGVSGQGRGGNTRPAQRSSSPNENDDIIARQLKEAAMAETDPELRAKILEEYKRYKGRL